MLFLYRPRQTYMPYSLPRNRTDQAAYNRQLQAKFDSSRRVPPAPPAAAAPDPCRPAAPARGTAPVGGADRRRVRGGPSQAHEEVTSNEARATTLGRALRAGLDRDRGLLAELCTEDVRAWTPAFAASGLAELLDVLDRRDEAFSDVALEVSPLDVGGAHACVEWSVAMTHTGRLVTAGDAEHRADRRARHDPRGHRRRVPRRADLLDPPVLGRAVPVRAAGRGRGGLTPCPAHLRLRGRARRRGCRAGRSGRRGRRWQAAAHR